MTMRLRVAAVAAVAVTAAAVVALTVALVGGGGGDESVTRERLDGVPPFVVDVGVRTDPEARALRLAAGHHRGGRHAAARRALAGRTSLQAQVGRAVASWPDGTLGRLERLAAAHPRSGAVQFHLGLVRLWSGDREGALAAWRAARSRDPDSAYAVRSSDLIYRRFPPGLPTFVPSFRAPRRVASLPPGRQLAALRRGARRPDARAKLLYGLALQRLDRPVSARRQYAAAARLAPRNPEALVADAVGRFDKAQPERAFERLGPLTRRFPRAATVRFHLGLLLLWLGDVEGARRQLTRAAALGSPLGREARRLLARLEDVSRS